ncbi:Mitochondrial distribution and morphology protein 12 [Coemansia sp. RSA 988]|nr:Mitochondrial distribution and morphology protein 12 [Coemansia sp. RSA 988]
MSFSIYWEKLDKRVAQSVQAQLNKFFANLEPRPSFLGEIVVEDLDFGSVPPYLEIQDLTEPFPEFYLATDDDNADDGNKNSEGGSNVSAKALERDLLDSSHYSGVDDFAELSGRLQQRPDQIGRPESQATVRSYFLNPRMDVIARSGTMTPVPHVWGPVQGLYHPPPPPELLFMAPTDGQPPGLGAQTISGSVAVERGEADIQLRARVEYCGDMTIVLRMELQLNYPAAQFVSLPVKMTITKIEFAATLVVAYLGNRVNVCFLEPDPPQRPSLLDHFSIRTEIGDADQHVLNNVEKLESFITEQLRNAIDDDFVFPSYHSFEMYDME